MSSADTPRTKPYRVKEAYYTLQGEGLQAGRAAVLCRFEGCDRCCPFCDTDFTGIDGPGGGSFDTPEALAQHLSDLISAVSATRTPSERYIIFTGGEPSLQLDDQLIAACHALDLTLGIETNGGHRLPNGLDWVCVSPKSWPIEQTEGDELKIVWPGGLVEQRPGESNEALETRALALLPRYEALHFAHLFLQPEDGPNRDWNTASAVRVILQRPRWRLSLQQHKLLGLR